VGPTSIILMLLDSEVFSQATKRWKSAETDIGIFTLVYPSIYTTRERLNGFSRNMITRGLCTICLNAPVLLQIGRQYRTFCMKTYARVCARILSVTRFNILPERKNVSDKNLQRMMEDILCPMNFFNMPFSFYKLTNKERTKWIALCVHLLTYWKL
jgi:hypothetical protein